MVEVINLLHIRSFVQFVILARDLNLGKNSADLNLIYKICKFHITLAHLINFRSFQILNRARFPQLGLVQICCISWSNIQIIRMSIYRLFHLCVLSGRQHNRNDRLLTRCNTYICCLMLIFSQIYTFFVPAMSYLHHNVTLFRVCKNW